MTTSITRRKVVSLLAATPALLATAARAQGREISESGLVPIGGIEQWIGIQGSDVDNPVILFLHGGPGEAQSPFLKNFLPWQGEYTVLNWDQRGSGRTYARNGASTPGMSTPEQALERLCEDARDVAQYACKRLSKNKVILVGQSWGAELGLHVVKRWPQLFHAYVGTGQPVSWRLKVEVMERWAWAQAAAIGDEQTLKALSDTASLELNDPRRTNATSRYRFASSDLEYVKAMGSFIGYGSPSPPTAGEAADWMAGSQFTFTKVAPIEYSLDARKLGLDFSLPFVVIQGRDDHIAPFEVAESYVAEVRAPKKAFVPIEGGHWACFTNAAGFLGALRQHVRPLAN